MAGSKTAMRPFAMAWKTVRGSLREYAGFFLAILLVQTLLGVCTVSYCNNKRIERVAAAGSYDYHFVMPNLNENQFYYISNVQVAEQEKDWIFDLRYRQRLLQDGSSRYDVYITLRGNAERTFSAFMERYGETLSEDGELTYGKTPLLDYADRLAEGRRSFGWLMLLCMGLSFLLLTVLYRIRINHHKFTYGIYLSFGADRKTLLRMSVCELLVITGLTLLPSLLLSYLLGVLLYLPTCGLLGFFLLPFLTVPVGSAVVVVLAALPPMTLLSRGRPTRLLIAEDNSNYVSSPRHSAWVTKKRMPVQIELLSVRRFRRYYAGLLLAASAFGMLLVAGSYLANCYRQNSREPVAAYTVDFSSSRYCAEDAIEALSSLKGVKAVTRDHSVSLLSGNSNLLIPKSKAIRGFVSYPRDPAYVGSLMVRCAPADAYAIRQIDDFYGYAYEGDPSLLERGNGYVIVYDAVANRKTVSLQPGDRIFVATDCHVYGMIRTEGEQFGFTVTLSGNDLLRSYFDACDFNYREFTVAAVISGAPAGEELLLQFSPEDFSAITKRKAQTQEAKLYLQEDLSEEDAAQLQKALQSLQDRYAGISVSAGREGEQAQTEAKKNFWGLFTGISLLLFAVCPLIWMFSQLLFYSKREAEMDIIRAVGGRLQEVRGIYRTDGITLAILGGGLYTLLSLGAVGLLCRLLNANVFQSLIFGAAGAHRYFPTLPMLPYLAGLLLTVLSAYLASELGWQRYRKKASEQISGVFTED